MNYHCDDLNMDNVTVSTEVTEEGFTHVFNINNSPLECFTYFHFYNTKYLEKPFLKHFYLGINRYSDELINKLKGKLTNTDDKLFKYYYVPNSCTTVHICKQYHIEKKLIRSKKDLHKELFNKMVMPKVTFKINEYKHKTPNWDKWDTNKDKTHIDLIIQCSEFVIRDFLPYMHMDYHDILTSITFPITTCKFGENSCTELGFFHKGKKQLLFNFPLMKGTNIFQSNNKTRISMSVDKFQLNIINNIRHELYKVMIKSIKSNDSHGFAKYCHHYGEDISDVYKFDGKLITITSDTKIFNEESDGTFSKINIFSFPIKNFCFLINNSETINAFVIIKFPYVMLNESQSGLYFPVHAHEIYITKTNKMKKWYYPNIKTEIEKLDISDLVSKLNTPEQVLKEIEFEI